MENQKEEKAALDQQEINDIALENAKRAVGLPTDDNEIDKDFKNNPNIITEDGFRHCMLNFGVNYAGNVFQFKNEMLLTDAEAYNAYRLLAKKMEDLNKTGLPVTLSMKIRNLDRKIICRCFTGIIYIEHDIPEIADVEEDENV